jgi:hypothetical protein
MITAKMDVMDGLVNEAIGTLRCIERLRLIDAHDVDYQAPGTSRDCGKNMAQQNKITLWFGFAQSSIGTQARDKCRPHVLSKPVELSQSWVPLRQRIVNITLSETLKCKRREFPVVPACLITVHKSQGSTFDEIVYKYSATQPQQSVYVALSLVTVVTGLHIIMHKGATFRFVHGRRGSNVPATLEMRDEYRRLEHHLLRQLPSPRTRSVTAQLPHHSVWSST